MLTYLLGAVVFAWFLAFLVLELVGCRPLKGNWDITLDPPAKCLNRKALFTGNSITNILTDIAIICLPMSQVWHLQMSRRSKVAICCIFLLGGL